MRDDKGNIQRINALATDSGLTLRGWFEIQAGDMVPVLESGRPATLLMLFGQAGSAVWSSFSRSPEFVDGKPDPMDRWSHRVGTLLAKQLGEGPCFPLKGPRGTLLVNGRNVQRIFAPRHWVFSCIRNAFTNGAYDVFACAEYLHSNDQSDCHRLGCLARGACPEGATAHYEPEHCQFHMHQFYSALKNSR